MLNLMVMLIFPVVNGIYLFSANLVENLIPGVIENMMNFMVISIFPVLNQKYSFWSNLAQKINITVKDKT